MFNPPLVRGTLLALSLFFVLVFAHAYRDAQSGQRRTTASGLTIAEVKKQDEPLVSQAGDFVWVHYTGKLQSNSKVFDSSLTRGPGEPIGFKLGARQVIPGWDEGIAGMKIGDKRQLIIPPNLPYAERGAGEDIPPNATLVFDVQLVGIYRP